MQHRNQPEFGEGSFLRTFFKAASETLLELAKDPRLPGAQTGFISILHTWGHRACTICTVLGFGRTGIPCAAERSDKTCLITRICTISCLVVDLMVISGLQGPVKRTFCFLLRSWLHFSGVSLWHTLKMQLIRENFYFMLIYVVLKRTKPF
jgi:hypothetical protein